MTPLYIPKELMHLHKRSMFGTEENKPRCVRYSVLVWFKCRTELVDSFRAKFSVEGRLLWSVRGRVLSGGLGVYWECVLWGILAGVWGMVTV